MRKRTFLALGIMFFVVMCMSISAEAVPGIIDYQGKLAETGGHALTGTYEMTFSLYPVESGGTALWGPEGQDVAITGGIFNVHMGSVKSFPSNLFDNDALYLHVRIYNPDTSQWETLSPRQRLTSTAFAMKADNSGATATNSLSAADGDPADAVYVNNDGKVGIGTTAPVNKLHLHTSDSSFSMIQFTNADTNYTSAIGGLRIGLSSNEDGALFMGEDKSLCFGTNNTERMIINNSGNLGIGAHVPKQKLQVAGNIALGNDLAAIRTDVWGGSYLMSPTYFIGDMGSYGLTLAWNGYRRSSDSLIEVIGDSVTNNSDTVSMIRFDDYGINLMCQDGMEDGDPFPQSVLHIKSNGNVGIGTSSPQAKLDINGGAVFGSTYNVTIDPYGNMVAFNRNNFNYISATDASGSLIFRTGGLEDTRMSILSNGNVGIGTSNPGHELDVTGIIRAHNPGGTTGTINLASPTGNPGIIITSNAPQGYRADIVRTTDGLGFGVHGGVGIPATKLFIANSGNVGIGTSNPTEKVHIYDQLPNVLFVKAESTRSGVYFEADGAGISGLKMAQGGVAKAYVYWHPNDFLALVESGLARLAIKGGNVGIGTTTPSPPEN